MLRLSIVRLRFGQAMATGRSPYLFLLILGASAMAVVELAKADDSDSVVFSVIPDTQEPAKCDAGFIGQPLPWARWCHEIERYFCLSLGLKAGGVVDLKTGPPASQYYRQIKCDKPELSSPAETIQAVSAEHPSRRCITAGIAGADPAAPLCADVAAQICSASKFSHGYIIDLHVEASANRTFREVQCFQKEWILRW